MKKIIVLGGGTAGWLTALLVREFYPQFEVTVVESDTIGILGLGLIGSAIAARLNAAYHEVLGFRSCVAKTARSCFHF